MHNHRKRRQRKSENLKHPLISKSRNDSQKNPLTNLSPLEPTQRLIQEERKKEVSPRGIAASLLDHQDEEKPEARQQPSQREWEEMLHAAESSKKPPILRFKHDGAQEQGTESSTESLPNDSIIKIKKLSLRTKSGRKPVHSKFFKPVQRKTRQTKSSISIELKTEGSSQSLTSSQG